MAGRRYQIIGKGIKTKNQNFWKTYKLNLKDFTFLLKLKKRNFSVLWVKISFFIYLSHFSIIRVNKHLLMYMVTRKIVPSNWGGAAGQRGVRIPVSLIFFDVILIKINKCF